MERAPSQESQPAPAAQSPPLTGLARPLHPPPAMPPRGETGSTVSIPECQSPARSKGPVSGEEGVGTAAPPSAHLMGPKPTRPHHTLTRQRRVAQRPGHQPPGLLEAPSQKDAGPMFAVTPSEQPTCPKPGSDGSKKGPPIPASRPEPGRRQPRATQGPGRLVQAGGSEEGQRKGTDPACPSGHKRRHRAFWRGSLAITLLSAHSS